MVLVGVDVSLKVQSYKHPGLASQLENYGVLALLVAILDRFERVSHRLVKSTLLFLMS
jgi:hypothetical protein